MRTRRFRLQTAMQGFVVAIQFQCHECGKTLSVKDELAGKKLKCPCGAVVTATAGTSQAAGTRPTRTAPGRTAAARPAAQPASARQVTPVPSGTAGGGSYLGGSNDLSSLFDELTESDLQTKQDREREAAESHAAAKDPLAAYSSNQGGRSSRTGGNGPRPVGLTILIALTILLAVVALALGLLALFGDQLFGDALAKIEFLSQIDSLTAVLLLIAGGLLGAVSAGLLGGQPWGWWLGTSAYAFGILNGIFSSIFALLEEATLVSLAVGIGQILISSGAIFYLLGEPRRRYFRIQTQPAVAAAVTLGGAAIIAFALQLAIHLMAADRSAP